MLERKLRQNKEYTATLEKQVTLLQQQQRAATARRTDDVIDTKKNDDTGETATTRHFPKNDDQDGSTDVRTTTEVEKDLTSEVASLKALLWNKTMEMNEAVASFNRCKERKNREVKRLLEVLENQKATIMTLMRDKKRNVTDDARAA